MTDDPRPGFNALRDKMLWHLEVHRAAKLEDLAQAAATFAYEALYLPGSPNVPHVQRTAPRRIYLCVSDDLDDRDEPFTEEVTWAADEAVNVTVPYVRADLAALAAPKAEAWQDISTAPKDGTTVLLGRDMGEFGFVRGYGHFDGKPGTYLSGWITSGFDPVVSNLGLAHPTVWQPLPGRPPAHQGATR